MRRCPAPMAARTAISRRRTVARASWRLATLAVAVISRRATAASSTRIAGLTSAVIACSSGTTDTSIGPAAPNSALAATSHVWCAARPRCCFGGTPVPAWRRRVNARSPGRSRRPARRCSPPPAARSTPSTRGSRDQETRSRAASRRRWCRACRSTEGHDPRYPSVRRTAPARGHTRGSPLRADCARLRPH